MERVSLEVSARRAPRLGRALPVSCLFLLATVASAQVVVSETARLVDRSPAAGDLFGVAVDVHADTVVAGAQATTLQQGGAVHVFVPEAGGWAQVAALASGAGPGAMLSQPHGLTVDAAGNRVDPDGTVTQVLEGTLGDHFGAALALDGDTLLVGAEGILGEAADARVLVRGGSSASWTEQARLVPPDADETGFGEAVALEGDTAVVGSPTNTAPVGGVHVFERAAGAWSLRQTLAAPAPGLGFGDVVALSGDVLAVGAPWDDEGANVAGAVFVYTRGAGGWTLDIKLLAPVPVPAAQFGASVALSGDTLVVGAPFETGHVLGSGVVHVFERSGSRWSGGAKLCVPVAAYGDRFGAAVAVEGDRVLVGAPDADRAAQDAGEAHVFDRDGGAWTHLAVLRASDAREGDQLGSAVALRGGLALAGAPNVDLAGASNAGAVYVFGAGPGVGGTTVDASASTDGPAPTVRSAGPGAWWVAVEAGVPGARVAVWSSPWPDARVGDALPVGEPVAFGIADATGRLELAVGQPSTRAGDALVLRAAVSDPAAPGRVTCSAPVVVARW